MPGIQFTGNVLRTRVSMRVRSDEVVRALDRANRRLEATENRILSRWGAIVRQDARRLIKIVAPTKKQEARLLDPNVPFVHKRKLRERLKKKNARTGRPGQPPVAHSRSNVRTLRNIRYIVRRPKVTIYVVRLGDPGGVPTPEGVPTLMEFGGSTSGPSLFSGKTRRLNYKPHPFLGTAERKSRDNRVKLAAEAYGKAIKASLL